MRQFRFLGFLGLACLAALPALALPAPMSEQELMEKSIYGRMDQQGKL